jgi:hypothetical protein
MWRFWLGVALLALVVLTAGPLRGQERPGGAAPPQGGAPAQLSSQRSVAATPPGVPDADRKRTQQLRGLVGLVLLTLIVIAFLLFLMVLTARWTRTQLPRREAGKGSTLEDLWWKVQGKPVSNEELARMLSEDTDKEKPKDDEPKKG